MLEAISKVEQKLDAYHSVTRNASAITVADFDRLLEELRICIQEVDDQGNALDVVDYEDQEKGTPNEAARAVGANFAWPDRFNSLRWLKRHDDRRCFW